MKRGRWLVALFCALVLLVCGSAISVSSANAQTEGKSFTALDLYRTQKITAQTPKTFETTIQLSKSVTERGGIIIGNYAGTPNAFSMEIFSNGNPRLYHRVDNNEYNCVFTGVDIRGDSYVHLAITLDPSDYKARCYVDGVLKETKPLIVPSYTYTNTPVVGGDLRSGNGVYFKGKMKSVALYSDVRTLAEVKADKTAVDVNDDNLLLAYDLDNSGAATFEDKSKNGNDLKANVAWVDDVAPPENYAYSFMV
ncbi:MAG: LamG domain-containing protein, partial [Clostridia bacterium]|nr:LamG domain-containing protein [Clostridia bacterium]